MQVPLTCADNHASRKGSVGWAKGAPGAQTRPTDTVCPEMMEGGYDMDMALPARAKISVATKSGDMVETVARGWHRCQVFALSNPKSISIISSTYLFWDEYKDRTKTSQGQGKDKSRTRRGQWKMSHHAPCEEVTARFHNNFCSSAAPWLPSDYGGQVFSIPITFLVPYLHSSIHDRR